MKIKDKFARMICSLIPIFQITEAQMNDTTSPSNEIMVAKSTPVIKFKLGPLVSTDARLYNNYYYLKLIKNYNKNVEEKVIEYKHGKPIEKREINPQESYKWNIRRGVEKRNSQLDWNQSNQLLLLFADRSPLKLPSVLEQIDDIYKQIKLKTLSNFFANLKAELSKVERTLTLNSFETFFKFLKEILVDTELDNQIKMTNINGNKGINNKAYQIQNQIENIFIFNLLLEENNSKLKEKYIDIFNRLTGRKMNEHLEKAVNNLNEKGILQGDVSADTQALPQNNQMDFMKQLQKNFSRIFHSQNVTLNHINQISKIIDFVERYHGVVSDLKTLSTVDTDDPVSQGSC